MRCFVLALVVVITGLSQVAEAACRSARALNTGGRLYHAEGAQLAGARGRGTLFAA
jgi:hypothetical protein